MGYDLPEDVGAVTGVRWFLVAVPDDPAYTRAALGAYTDLGHYWKWGLEGPVPVESDLAAQQWLDAIAETMEALEMGFPDILLGHIDGVETLLQSLLDKPCCEGGDVYDIVTDPDGVIQPLPDETGGDIVRDEGDPPGGIVDWPTYDQRLCEAAARFADSLPGWITALEAMSIIVSLGLVAAAAYLIAGLAAAGISVAVATGAMGLLEAVEWLEDLRDLFNLGPSWQDARDELELQDTKDAIICAILLSDTPAAAEAAIDAALASEAPAAYDAIKTLPLRFMMNKIFNMETDAGGFGGYTCPECEEPPTGLFWAITGTIHQYKIGSAAWADYSDTQSDLPVVNGQEILWRKKPGVGTARDVVVRFVDALGVNTDSATASWAVSWTHEAPGNSLFHAGYSWNGSTDVVVHASHLLAINTPETGLPGYKHGFTGNDLNSDTRYVTVTVTGA